LAGAPDHERASRGSPKTQVIATRSKRGRRSTRERSTMFIAIMEASAGDGRPVINP
jgi:hypothetical protein